jgi:YHS domain-containing protein
MVKDPVCGMYMDSRLAVRFEEGGETVFFCSEECKSKFLAGVRAGEIPTNR